MKAIARLLMYAVFAMAGPVLLFAGCENGARDNHVIRVTRNIGGREGFRRHFDVWKATFEEQNPDWTMELIDLGDAEGSEFYKSRIATGDLPEVIMTWQMTNFLADSGHLVQLPDDYYTRFGIPMPDPYKGQRYNTMGGLQIQGIVINRPMWEAIGVTSPPATWDAYFEAFEKLKEKGFRPLVLGGREWSASMPAFYAMASDMWDREVAPGNPSWTARKDQGAISFATDPVARQIVETMIHLVENFVDKGVLSDGYTEEQRDFYGGQGATWMMGCWMAGDLEPNQVDFEMDYWPVPSLLGRDPVFVHTSGPQSGWAMTTSATGEKREKALAVLETFYDPAVYQEYLNGECQFGIADLVATKEPRYDWAPAQGLIERMRANLQEHGMTRGMHIASDDLPPASFTQTMMRMMQEIMAGNRDVAALLKMLDDDWDSARKGT